MFLGLSRIPKKPDPKGGLECTNPKSRDWEDVMKVINQSFHDYRFRDVYSHHWKVDGVQIVRNKQLELEFREKRKTIRESHVDVNFSYAFKVVREAHGIDEVATNGLTAETGPYNALGPSSQGVYLCRNADHLLRIAQENNLCKTTLLVCKILFGRHKRVNPNPERPCDPPPNFDSVSTAQEESVKDSLKSRWEKAQIYLYEYDEETALPSKHPRHCLPYAVVTYTNKKHNENLPVTDRYSDIESATCSDNSDSIPRQHRRSSSGHRGERGRADSMRHSKQTIVRRLSESSSTSLPRAQSSSNLDGKTSSSHVPASTMPRPKGKHNNHDTSIDRIINNTLSCTDSGGKSHSRNSSNREANQKRISAGCKELSGVHVSHKEKSKSNPQKQDNSHSGRKRSHSSSERTPHGPTKSKDNDLKEKPRKSKGLQCSKEHSSGSQGVPSVNSNDRHSKTAHEIKVSKDKQSSVNHDRLIKTGSKSSENKDRSGGTGKESVKKDKESSHDRKTSKHFSKSCTQNKENSVHRSHRNSETKSTKDTLHSRSDVRPATENSSNPSSVPNKKRKVQVHACASSGGSTLPVTSGKSSSKRPSTASERDLLTESQGHSNKKTKSSRKRNKSSNIEDTREESPPRRHTGSTSRKDSLNCSSTSDQSHSDQGHFVILSVTEKVNTGSSGDKNFVCVQSSTGSDSRIENMEPSVPNMSSPATSPSAVVTSTSAVIGSPNPCLTTVAASTTVTSTSVTTTRSICSVRSTTVETAPVSTESGNNPDLPIENSDSDNVFKFLQSLKGLQIPVDVHVSTTSSPSASDETCQALGRDRSNMTKVTSSHVASPISHVRESTNLTVVQSSPTHSPISCNLPSSNQEKDSVSTEIADSSHSLHQNITSSHSPISYNLPGSNQANDSVNAEIANSSPSLNQNITSSQEDTCTNTSKSSVVANNENKVVDSTSSPSKISDKASSSDTAETGSGKKLEQKHPVQTIEIIVGEEPIVLSDSEESQCSTTTSINNNTPVLDASGSHLPVTVSQNSELARLLQECAPGKSSTTAGSVLHTLLNNDSGGHKTQHIPSQGQQQPQENYISSDTSVNLETHGQRSNVAHVPQSHHKSHRCDSLDFSPRGIPSSSGMSIINQNISRCSSSQDGSMHVQARLQEGSGILSFRTSNNPVHDLPVRANIRRRSAPCSEHVNPALNRTLQPPQRRPNSLETAPTPAGPLERLSQMTQYVTMASSSPASASILHTLSQAPPPYPSNPSHLPSVDHTGSNYAQPWPVSSSNQVFTGIPSCSIQQRVNQSAFQNQGYNSCRFSGTQNDNMQNASNICEMQGVQPQVRYHTGMANQIQGTLPPSGINGQPFASIPHQTNIVTDINQRPVNLMQSQSQVFSSADALQMNHSHALPSVPPTYGRSVSGSNFAGSHGVQYIPRASGTNSYIASNGGQHTVTAGMQVPGSLQSQMPVSGQPPIQRLPHQTEEYMSFTNYNHGNLQQLPNVNLMSIAQRQLWEKKLKSEYLKRKVQDALLNESASVPEWMSEIEERILLFPERVKVFLNSHFQKAKLGDDALMNLFKLLIWLRSKHVNYVPKWKTATAAVTSLPDSLPEPDQNQAINIEPVQQTPPLSRSLRLRTCVADYVEENVGPRTINMPSGRVITVQPLPLDEPETSNENTLSGSEDSYVSSNRCNSPVAPVWEVTSRDPTPLTVIKEEPLFSAHDAIAPDSHDSSVTADTGSEGVLMDLSSAQHQDVNFLDISGFSRPTSREYPDRPHSEEAPLTTMVEGTALTTMVEGTALTTMAEGTPLTTMVEGTALTTMVEGTALTTMAEGTPLTTIVEGTPLTTMVECTEIGISASSETDGTDHGVERECHSEINDHQCGSAEQFPDPTSATDIRPSSKATMNASFPEPSLINFLRRNTTQSPAGHIQNSPASASETVDSYDSDATEAYEEDNIHDRIKGLNLKNEYEKSPGLNKVQNFQTTPGPEPEILSTSNRTARLPPGQNGECDAEHGKGHKHDTAARRLKTTPDPSSLESELAASQVKSNNIAQGQVESNLQIRVGEDGVVELIALHAVKTPTRTDKVGGRSTSALKVAKEDHIGSEDIAAASPSNTNRSRKSHHAGVSGKAVKAFGVPKKPCGSLVLCDSWEDMDYLPSPGSEPELQFRKLPCNKDRSNTFKESPLVQSTEKPGTSQTSQEQDQLLNKKSKNKSPKSKGGDCNVQKKEVCRTARKRSRKRKSPQKQNGNCPQNKDNIGDKEPTPIPQPEKKRRHGKIKKVNIEDLRLRAVEESLRAKSGESSSKMMSSVETADRGESNPSQSSLLSQSDLNKSVSDEMPKTLPESKTIVGPTKNDIESGNDVNNSLTELVCAESDPNPSHCKAGNVSENLQISHSASGSNSCGSNQQIDNTVASPAASVSLCKPSLHVEMLDTARTVEDPCPSEDRQPAVTSGRTDSRSQSVELEDPTEDMLHDFDFDPDVYSEDENLGDIQDKGSSRQMEIQAPWQQYLRHPAFQPKIILKDVLKDVIFGKRLNLDVEQDNPNPCENSIDHPVMDMPEGQPQSVDQRCDQTQDSQGEERLESSCDHLESNVEEQPTPRQSDEVFFSMDSRDEELCERDSQEISESGQLDQRDSLEVTPLSVTDTNGNVTKNGEQLDINVPEIIQGTAAEIPTPDGFNLLPAQDELPPESTEDIPPSCTKDREEPVIRKYDSIPGLDFVNGPKVPSDMVHESYSGHSSGSNNTVKSDLPDAVDSSATTSVETIKEGFEGMQQKESEEHTSSKTTRLRCQNADIGSQKKVETDNDGLMNEDSRTETDDDGLMNEDSRTRVLSTAISLSQIETDVNKSDIEKEVKTVYLASEENNSEQKLVEKDPIIVNTHVNKSDIEKEIKNVCLTSEENNSEQKLVEEDPIIVDTHVNKCDIEKEIKTVCLTSEENNSEQKLVEEDPIILDTQCEDNRSVSFTDPSDLYSDISDEELCSTPNRQRARLQITVPCDSDRRVSCLDKNNAGNINLMEHESSDSEVGHSKEPSFQEKPEYQVEEVCPGYGQPSGVSEDDDLEKLQNKRWNIVDKLTQLVDEKSPKKASPKSVVIPIQKKDKLSSTCPERSARKPKRHHHSRYETSHNRTKKKKRSSSRSPDHYRSKSKLQYHKESHKHHSYKEKGHHHKVCSSRREQRKHHASGFKTSTPKKHSKYTEEPPAKKSLYTDSSTVKSIIKEKNKRESADGSIENVPLYNAYSAGSNNDPLNWFGTIKAVNSKSCQSRNSGRFTPGQMETVTKDMHGADSGISATREKMDPPQGIPSVLDTLSTEHIAALRKAVATVHDTDPQQSSAVNKKGPENVVQEASDMSLCSDNSVDIQLYDPSFPTESPQKPTSVPYNHGQSTNTARLNYQWFSNGQERSDFLHSAEDLSSASGHDTGQTWNAVLDGDLSSLTVAKLSCRIDRVKEIIQKKNKDIELLEKDLSYGRDVIADYDMVEYELNLLDLDLDILTNYRSQVNPKIKCLAHHPLPVELLLAEEITQKVSVGGIPLIALHDQYESHYNQLMQFKRDFESVGNALLNRPDEMQRYLLHQRRTVLQNICGSCSLEEIQMLKTKRDRLQALQSKLHPYYGHPKREKYLDEIIRKLENHLQILEYIKSNPMLHSNGAQCSGQVPTQTAAYVPLSSNVWGIPVLMETNHPQVAQTAENHISGTSMHQVVNKTAGSRRQLATLHGHAGSDRLPSKSDKKKSNSTDGSNPLTVVHLASSANAKSSEIKIEKQLTKNVDIHQQTDSIPSKDVKLDGNPPQINNSVVEKVKKIPKYLMSNTVTPATVNKVYSEDSVADNKTWQSSETVVSNNGQTVSIVPLTLTDKTASTCNPDKSRPMLDANIVSVDDSPKSPKRINFAKESFATPVEIPKNRLQSEENIKLIVHKPIKKSSERDRDKDRVVRWRKGKNKDPDLSCLSGSHQQATKTKSNNMVKEYDSPMSPPREEQGGLIQAVDDQDVKDPNSASVDKYDSPLSPSPDEKGHLMNGDKRIESSSVEKLNKHPHKSPQNHFDSPQSPPAEERGETIRAIKVVQSTLEKSQKSSQQKSTNVYDSPQSPPPEERGPKQSVDLSTTARMLEFSDKREVKLVSPSVAERLCEDAKVKRDQIDKREIILVSTSSVKTKLNPTKQLPSNQCKPGEQSEKKINTYPGKKRMVKRLNNGGSKKVVKATKPVDRNPVSSEVKQQKKTVSRTKANNSDEGQLKNPMHQTNSPASAKKKVIHTKASKELKSQHVQNKGQPVKVLRINFEIKDGSKFLVETLDNGQIRKKRVPNSKSTKDKDFGNENRLGKQRMAEVKQEPNLDIPDNFGSEGRMGRFKEYRHEVTSSHRGESYQNNYQDKDFGNENRLGKQRMAEVKQEPNLDIPDNFGSEGRMGRFKEYRHEVTSRHRGESYQNNYKYRQSPDEQYNSRFYSNNRFSQEQIQRQDDQRHGNPYWPQRNTFRGQGRGRMSNQQYL